jgi:hypothetical protein
MSSLSEINAFIGKGVQVAFACTPIKKDPTVEEMKAKVVKILGNGKPGDAAKAADYIRANTSNADKQIKVLDAVRQELLAGGEFEDDSIAKTIGEIRKLLGLPPVVEAEAVESIETSGEIKSELVSVVKSGAFGGDGSPQVIITVKIENLPKGAHTLSGFIRTNQDWPAGGAMTEGKTSGTFKFTAYLYPSNFKSPFYIKIADKEGNQIGRIPGGEEDFIEILMPND